MNVPPKASVPKAPVSSRGARLGDYALIAAKEIFHTSKETLKTGRKHQSEDIKVTEPNLDLIGTVVGDGKASYAFILDRGEK